MRKGLSMTIAAVFSLLLACHILLSFVMIVGLNSEIYKEAQVEDRIFEYAGISQETLDRVTIGLIDYIQDKRDDLVILSGDDINNELFNAKEKAHMVDVKNLFLAGKKINTAMFLILVLILIFYLTFDKVGMKKHFMKYCVVSLSIVLGLWIIIAILAMMDFTTFWTTFHKIFFTNELWLLNPSTDLLIRMMPQRFFVRIVLQIVTRFLSSYIGLIIICAVGHSILNRKTKKTAGV